MDCTVGTGGHALEMLKHSGGGTRLICLDVDAEALEIASERLKKYESRVTFFRRNYKELADVLKEKGIAEADGVLADLGVSSLQLDRAGRGFSFSKEGPLDMRMDRRTTLTAADIVNNYSCGELAGILKKYGEERHARKIANRIANRRKDRPFETTSDLAGLIAKTIKADGIHPATRTFQALRIKVNRELEGLEGFIEDTVECLSPGGRSVIISFHSLEDRIVKHTYRRLEKGCVCPPDLPVCGCGEKPAVKVLTGRPVYPSEEEKRTNPRSRSARLRAAEKLECDDDR